MSKIPVLFALMEAKGIKAQKLSADTGISVGNISDWRNGKCLPSSKKIAILAQYLGVTSDFLLGNDKKNTPTAESDSERIIRHEKYMSKIDRMTPEQLKMLDVFMSGLEKSDQ